MQQIINKTLEAINKYNLIEDGDKIAIGLSGGKDSLTLMLVMNTIQKFYPKKFSIVAIAVDMFNGQNDYSLIQKLCDDNGIELVIEKTEIYDILFNVRKETNPCSLCSKLRKGVLNNKAKELGCNKVALGHHGDDFVETFFLSMIYEGRLSTFAPSCYLDRTQITQIRPMLLVREKLIKKFALSSKLPILHNPCPADKHTKREEIKQIMANMEEMNPKLVNNVLHSLVDFDRQQGFFS